MRCEFWLRPVKETRVNLHHDRKRFIDSNTNLLNMRGANLSHGQKICCFKRLTLLPRRESLVMAKILANTVLVNTEDLHLDTKK